MLDLIHSGFEVAHLWGTKEFMDRHEKVPGMEEIAAADYARLSQFESPPGVMAVAYTRAYSLDDLDLSAAFTLALDGISDPGNLGTILRTADWYGISQVLLSPNCTDLYNHKCIAASMGSFAHVKCVYTDLGPVLKGRNTYGLYLGGDSIYDVKVQRPAILVLGSEANGISSGLEGSILHRITIPGHGRAESLNAAVAAGIAMDRLSHLH